MEKRRQPEIIAGQVAGATGAIVAGDGFTVQRVSTGNYVLTFPSGFRLVGISLTIASSNEIFYLGPTDRTVVVQTASTAGGALFDGNFSFIAVGVQV